MQTAEERSLSAGEAVREAARRLAVSFPPSFAPAAAALAGVASLGWRLWPPEEWSRVSTELSGWDYGGPNGAFDEDGYAGPEGVVIGGDDAGNIVCLLAAPGSRELAEAVFRWEHETATFTQIAARMAELPELLEALGDSLLEPPSSTRSNADAPAATGALCTFCGTELAGSRCGVCSRSAGDPPEEDAAAQTASRLLLALLDAKLVELERPSEILRLSADVAEVLDASPHPDEAAAAIGQRLIADSSVRDLFASDAEIAHVLRVIGRRAL